MLFTLLRGSLALVLGAGGPAVLIGLGVCELAAAALFAVPRTTRAGGFALLGVLVAAVALHAAAGDAPPVSFAVYAAAIWAVMADHRRAAAVAA